jgi:hypothetical protein
MSKVIRVRVDNDISFLVEVADTEHRVESTNEAFANLPPGARPTGTIADSVESMSSTVRAVVDCVRKGFVRANHPDELGVEFSITLKGSTGIPVVASGSTEGTFKIAAKWRNAVEVSK